MKNAAGHFFVLLFSLVITTSSVFAEIRLTHDRDYILPGVVPNAALIHYEVAFADFDGDSSQEALILCLGQSVHMYDFEQDSVVWKYEPAVPIAPLDIATADVDGDEIPDILVAETSSGSAGHACYGSIYNRLLVFDGASGWTQQTEIVVHGCYADSEWPLIEFAEVAVLDYDHDSASEVVFMHSVSSCLAGTGCYEDTLIGGTDLYSDVLESPDQFLTDRLSNLKPITMANGITGTIGLRRRFRLDVPERYYMSDRDIISLLPDGSVYTIFQNNYPTPDSSEYSGFCYANQFVRLLCVGDIDTTFPGEEALVNVSPARYCAYSNPDTTQSKDYRLQLWRLLDSDQPEIIWERIDSGYQTAHMDNAGVVPQNPGTFFSFYRDRLIQFDGHTGLAIDSTANEFRCSILDWSAPIGDGEGCLVCGSGTEGRLATYRVDTPTDVADEDPDLTIPQAFELSQPYPNPFNPSVSFSIALPHRADVTIEVVNVLGQRVAEIFAGRLTAGERTFTWDASAHASGLYFVRATVGLETSVQKAILLK